MWKYSPEYYPGTEVTNCPFNILTAHLKRSNPFKTLIPVYISIKYRSTCILYLFIICILCLYLFYYLYFMFVPFYYLYFMFVPFYYLYFIPFYYLYFMCIYLFIICILCTFFIICILCLYCIFYLLYSLYFMFVPFLLSVFYVCTFLLSVFYVPFLLSVFYVCTYIFYTYIYCYVAIGEHWRRLFCSKVNISENCVFIFSLDFNFFQLSQKHHFWLISLDLTEGFV